MTTVSLKDLKAKRAAMTEAGTPWCVQGPWPQATIYVDNAAIDDDSIHPTHVATMAASVLNGQSTTDDPDATGIVATHNAADCLIEIAEAAKVWQAARDVVRETDVIIAGSSCVMRLLRAEAQLVAALAKIQP